MQNNKTRGDFFSKTPLIIPYTCKSYIDELLLSPIQCSYCSWKLIRKEVQNQVSQMERSLIMESSEVENFGQSENKSIRPKDIQVLIKKDN